jgi:hypothetical protein
VLNPDGVGFRLAIILCVPCVFLLHRVLVVFSVISIHMVSEPNSSLSLGRSCIRLFLPCVVDRVYLALGNLRIIFSWASINCVWSVVGCGRYMYFRLPVSRV